MALVLGLGLISVPAASATPGPADAPEWWFDTWGVMDLWSQGARGAGITIGEIDTGVNASLPELSANVLAGKNFGPDGGDGRTDRSSDPFGHGTAMASLMVAHPGAFGIAGVAPDAKILPIAVPIRGTTDAAGEDDIAAAIRYAADHGAKIINMSLGGARSSTRDSQPCDQDEQDAIDYAIRHGLIVVASGGNSGQSASPVEDPSVCLGVVSVGAVDRDGTVPAFSSRHRYLTVTAPGVNIPTLGRVPGDAYSGEGTSQAAAITSGVLAMIWSKFPTQTARQIVARLLATLDHRRTVRSTSYGFGIINARSAITATVPLSAANPVYTALDPFLAVEAAGVAPTTKVPVVTARPLGGQVKIGSRPGPVTHRVLEWAGLALLGLLGLVMLVVRGGRRRPGRRRPNPIEQPSPSWSG